METCTSIGILGCGNISQIYFENLSTRFPWIQISGCTDLVAERAAEKAEAFQCRAYTSLDEMLQDDDIDIVLNLSTPLHHAPLNRTVLTAGKHVYVEKPLAVTLEDAADTLALAREKGLSVGCAPDTFLGAGLQTCRRLIDQGAIGRITSCMGFMTNHGHESWHPDPEFYYQHGGGPMLDMGPYYLTAMIHLCGPISGVTGITGTAVTERVITSEKKHGQRIPVEVPTHVTGLLEFENQAIGTLVTSFDVWKADLPFIEVHGTEGSLQVPDPNGFGGPVKLFTPDNEDWQEITVSPEAYAENARGIGLADMALGIREKRPHRASGSLAAHVLDVMLSLHTSSEKGTRETIASRCVQPEALPERIAAEQEW